MAVEVKKGRTLILKVFNLVKDLQEVSNTEGKSIIRYESILIILFEYLILFTLLTTSTIFFHLSFLIRI